MKLKGDQDPHIAVVVEHVPRLALRATEVAAALGISARTFRSWRAAGKVPAPTISIGRVQLWSVDDLREWLAVKSSKERKGP